MCLFQLCVLKLSFKKHMKLATFDKERLTNRRDLKFERRPRSCKEDPQIPPFIALPRATRCGFELSWGKLRREPATRWFDESFAPLLRSGGNDLHVSSAQRKLPPSFHLASPCPSKVHHLSGLNRTAQSSTTPIDKSTGIYPNWINVRRRLPMRPEGVSAWKLLSLRRWHLRQCYDSPFSWTPWSVFRDGSEGRVCWKT